MGRNQSAEFTSTTAEEVVSKRGPKCENCNSHLENDEITLHHILPLWYAKIFFPEISNAALRNILNCKILCPECHGLEHALDDPKQRYTNKKHLYRKQAAKLRRLDKKINRQKLKEQKKIKKREPTGFRKRNRATQY